MSDLFTDYYFWGAFGLAIGSSLAVRNLVKSGVRFPWAVFTIMSGIYGGLIGARVLYVMEADPGLFRKDLVEALRFWEGGLSWIGGAFLSGAVMFGCLLRRPSSAWSDFGGIAPGLALTHALSRIGCIVRGCCYGTPTLLPWAVYSERAGCHVHPTQIYDMVGELASTLILQLLWRRPERRRYLFPLYGMLYAIQRFVVEFVRGDTVPSDWAPGLTFHQVSSVFLFLISLTLFLILARWKRSSAFAAIVLAGLGAWSYWGSCSQPVQLRYGDNLKILVVTRSVFSEEARVWMERKKAQGFDAEMMAWPETPTPEEVKGWIRNAAADKSHFLVIVGDCSAGQKTTFDWEMPTCGLKNGGFSDIPFGDLDSDGRPDLAVGRIPVRARQELGIYFAKTSAYERALAAGNRNHAILWAGAKGYEDAVEAGVSSTGKSIPSWMSVSVVSGKTAGQPSRFLEAVTSPLLFSLIVSHGSYRSVSLGDRAGQESILTVEDVTHAFGEGISGPLIMLGCESGLFALEDDKGPCLAEAFLSARSGPVAVISATGPTNPMSNYLTAKTLASVLTQRPLTVGEFWLGVEQALCEEGEATLLDIAKDDPVAEKIAVAVPEDRKHRLTEPGVLHEDVLKYSLLGDPTSPFIVR